MEREAILQSDPTAVLPEPTPSTRSDLRTLADEAVRRFHEGVRERGGQDDHRVSPDVLALVLAQSAARTGDAAV